MLCRGSVAWRVIGRGGGTVVATPLWLRAYLVHIVFCAHAKVDGNSEINGAAPEEMANQANVLHNSGKGVGSAPCGVIGAGLRRDVQQGRSFRQPAEPLVAAVPSRCCRQLAVLHEAW